MGGQAGGFMGTGIGNALSGLASSYAAQQQGLERDALLIRSQYMNMRSQMLSPINQAKVFTTFREELRDQIDKWLRL